MYVLYIEQSLIAFEFRLRNLSLIQTNGQFLNNLKVSALSGTLQAFHLVAGRCNMLKLLMTRMSLWLWTILLLLLLLLMMLTVGRFLIIWMQTNVF